LRPGADRSTRVPVTQQRPEVTEIGSVNSSRASLYGFGLCLLFFYFALERLLFERRLRRIPLRLAVTGTRGKSTVTRLIAGALRAVPGVVDVQMN
jgi:hypothetical protein